MKGRIDTLTDRQTDIRTDGHDAGGCKDRQIEGLTKMDTERRADRQTNIQTPGRRQTHRHMIGYNTADFI